MKRPLQQLLALTALPTLPAFTAQPALLILLWTLVAGSAQAAEPASLHITQALAQGTAADPSAPKALGEVTIKATPQGDSYTPTATSTATKGSAPPCAMCHRP